MREPFRRVGLHLDAARETVQRLAEVVLLVIRPGEPTVEAETEGADVERVHVERREHSAAASGFAAHLRRARNVADARGEGDLVAGCDHEVGATVRMPEIIARLRAALELGPARHVVANETGAPTHARLVVAQVPGPEDVAH